MLLKLGRRVEGGAGPDGDIVAFTTVCPHKGFPLTYDAADKTLNCPGHYSRFDCREGRPADLGAGHAEPAAIPPARRPSKGDIYAEGVDELLYGRLSNVL